MGLQEDQEARMPGPTAWKVQALTLRTVGEMGCCVGVFTWSCGLVGYSLGEASGSMETSSS